MKHTVLMLVGAIIVITSVTIILGRMYHPSHEFSAGVTVVASDSVSPSPTVSEKPLAERIKDAQEKSSDVKGIYMTAEVASDGGAGATRLRNQIINIANTTEVNAIVIDVKEVCGPEFNSDRIKKLIDELHQNHIWAIARIVAFKDSSQIYAHPEWYLKRAAPKVVKDDCANKMYLRADGPDGKKTDAVLWRDNKGGYWLDPASLGAREYIANFGKKIIDLGFDELQFDYIRFPSDGDVAKANFPVWDGKTPKYAVLKSFFSFLHDSLKGYKPEIVLSADMFGYAAIREGDVGIGQRLEDIVNSFDYVSFMVYPSHYYSVLYLDADAAHNLPAVNYDGKQVRIHPDVTVGRSLQVAQNFLDDFSSRSASSTTAMAASDTAVDALVKTHVKLRPWLEDFFHDADARAGRPYGAQKVRMQIDAAEHVSGHGWLLWNAANVYTTGALKKN